MTKGHLKVGKQGTELNRIKYQLQIMVQYFIRLCQNLAYDRHRLTLSITYVHVFGKQIIPNKIKKISSALTRPI